MNIKQINYIFNIIFIEILQITPPSMSKIDNISIVLSFLALWMTSLFNSELEIILGFSLIFSFGILHGSNDIVLISNFSVIKEKYTFIKILITYILIVIFAIAIFYLIPIFGLVLFILFSAYHFGEQHWESKKVLKQTILEKLFFTCYGLLVLQLLFVLNAEDVIEVIYAISKTTINYKSIVIVTYVSAGLFLVMSAYIFIKNKTFKTVLLKEVFFLLIFTIIFKVSSLIWGFAIYFIFWHSIPSLVEQVTFLHKEVNKNTVLKYFKTAFPYWMISVIGVFGVYLIFKNDSAFYAIFFSFIAAVTFPHTLVINKLFKSKKQ